MVCTNIPLCTGLTFRLIFALNFPDEIVKFNSEGKDVDILDPVMSKICINVVFYYVYTNFMTCS